MQRGEIAAGPHRDERPDQVLAEDGTEDAAGRVVVVDVVEQVTQHQQQVGTVGGAGEVLEVAVDIGHDGDQHPVEASRGSSRDAVPGGVGAGLLQAMTLTGSLLVEACSSSPWPMYMPTWDTGE